MLDNIRDGISRDLVNVDYDYLIINMLVVLICSRTE